VFILGAVVTLAIAYAIGVRLFGKLPLPPIIHFALGAAVESFLIYLFFLDRLGWLIPVLAVFIPFLFFARRPTISVRAFPLFAVFGIYYLVQALTPEIQPDAISYHLGLTAEYLRLGAFPKQITFYEILPQGLEMLFAMAFAIGRDTAAKLVHFSFLLATIPLIVLTARRLNLTEWQGYAAAALYFFAPVVGLSGTCAYNDAALVFFTLATFYLLLIEQPGCAGITAGFCYAIKFTGLLVPVLALGYILWKRMKPVKFCLGAALMIAPWMLRALILTHNPFAPLFNSIFPNLYFNAVTERALSHALSSYQGFTWLSALWVWAITGAAQGVIGPLILAAPLALLAWRKPAGRLLLITALLLLAPVAFNVGTRFLMPSLPFLALALVMALPRPAILVLTVLQAIICFPLVVIHFERPQSWALKGFPWQAALRIQPEAEYLRSATGDYSVARYIEEHTTSLDQVFALNGISTLFTTRDVLEYWHSNRAERYTAALQSAYSKTTTVRTHWEWQPILLSAIRLISTADLNGKWSVYDVRLSSPGGPLYNSPQWTLIGSPNPSGAPAAFDGNPATFWSSRTPPRRGMFLEADFDHPQLLNAVQVTIGANALEPGFAIQGRAANSRDWKLLTDRWTGKVNRGLDLRSDAVYALHHAGFSVISVYANAEGLGQIGSDMVKNQKQWSLQDLGGYGDFHLMRIIEP
jgi:hypothetical protein